MRTILKRWLPLAGLLSLGVVPTASAACPALLDHQFTSLQDGKPMPLCQYAGKVILVVNTASYCGFTSQYDGLEKLYARLRDRGLVVLGFPSNDFGEQEPGSEKEIAEFCRMTYGVEFPMAAKTTVKGRNAHPFFVKLADVTGSRPKWNFHKYLINRDASQVVAFSSFTKPDDRDLLKKIDEFLQTASPKEAK
jgi:glutathione peroxidase